MATSISLGITPGGMMSFIFFIRWAMCFGLFSSKCSISRSNSPMARITRGSSKSGVGPSSPASAVAAAGSLTPFGMANRLI